MSKHIEIRRQKLFVVRESLWALTGQAVLAAVLGQMLYWSLRTHDVDAYLEEERERMLIEPGEEPSIEPTHGWVYKTAEELTKELMGICSISSIRRHLVTLKDRKWLDRRRNPKHRWDRTWQYRPDWKVLDTDLGQCGYSLEDALPPGDWIVVRNRLPARQE